MSFKRLGFSLKPLYYNYSSKYKFSKYNFKTTTHTQQQYFYAAHDEVITSMSKIIDTFLSIQKSDNPLTIYEVGELIKRRPNIYYILVPYYKQMIFNHFGRMEDEHETTQNPISHEATTRSK